MENLVTKEIEGWAYGEEGWFDVDISIALAGLDEEGLLEQKEKPVRPHGRMQGTLFIEALRRRVKVDVEMATMTPVILDIIDAQPDVVAEHLARKDKRRAHDAASRYQKVRRQWTEREGCRAVKNIDRRRMRRKLNDAVRSECEPDIIGKHGCEFANRTGKAKFKYDYLD